jgi:transcriptional regulator with XRE-family HTH domain
MASDDLMDNGTVADSVRELLAAGGEAAQDYLKENFLIQAMLALFHARREAHLTQAQVAAQMGTKQSAITRWEKDFDGSITLRRYVEFALACGKMPFDISLAPTNDIAAFLAENPGESATDSCVNRWLIESHGPVVGGEGVVGDEIVSSAPTMQGPLGQGDNFVKMQDIPQYSRHSLSARSPSLQMPVLIEQEGWTEAPTSTAIFQQSIRAGNQVAAS